MRVYRGGSSPLAIYSVCLSVCASKSKLPSHSDQARTLSRPICKHAQRTHATPTLPLGDTPNTRALPQTLALSVDVVELGAEGVCSKS